MSKLEWGAVGTRMYETGTDRGVLFLMGDDGKYKKGVAWTGLTAVNESPDGAEESPLYADNGKYLSMYSTENFKGSISAYMYPTEFKQCDGSKQIAVGVIVGQQDRTPFGFSYRTIVGNDVKKNAFGYKIHLVYQAQCGPSERSFETINDSPNAVTFSWDFTTTPVTPKATGVLPTAHLTIDSTEIPAATLVKLEELIYGTDAKESTLPSIDEVIALVGTPEAGGGE